MDIQEITVILVGLGCILWIGIRIYRSFKGIGEGNDPCTGCPTDCELHRKLRERQRICEKNHRKSKKSCCG